MSVGSLPCLSIIINGSLSAGGKLSLNSFSDKTVVTMSDNFSRVYEAYLTAMTALAANICGCFLHIFLFCFVYVHNLSC